MPDRIDPEAPLRRWGEKLGVLLVGLTLLLFLGMLAFALGDAVLAPSPVPEHPGFADSILGSRAVVAAIRLSIIFAGAFVVVSVVALMANGQWLIKVGPVQVSEQVADIDAESRSLRESLDKSHEAIETLRQDISLLVEQMSESGGPDET